MLVREALSTAYACSTLNSDMVASTRLGLYQKSKRGQGKTVQDRCGDTQPISRSKLKKLLKARPALVNQELKEVTSHPLLDLLNNPVDVEENGVGMSLYILMAITQFYLEVVGRAYWYVPRDGPGGTPSEIWVMPAQYITEQGWGATGRIIDKYIYSGIGDRNEYDPEEIIPFRFTDLATGGYLGGFSPMRAAYEQVQLTRLFDGHTNAMLRNAGMPAAIWSPKNDSMGAGIDESAAIRMKAKFQRNFRQAGRGGLMIAESEGTLNPLTFKYAELMSPEQFKMVRSSIASCFHVPMALLDLNDANLASAQTAEYSHAKHAGEPRCKLLEAAINTFLLPMYDPDGRIFAAFDSPIPDDEIQDLARHKSGVETGSITFDEFRESIGKDPLDVGGDFRPIPNTYTMIDPETGKPFPPPAPPAPATMPEAKPVEPSDGTLPSPKLGNGGEDFPSGKKKELKYSDDEPRDENGEWTSGGGTSGGGGAAASALPADHGFDTDPQRMAARDTVEKANQAMEKAAADTKAAAKTYVKNVTAQYKESLKSLGPEPADDAPQSEWDKRNELELKLAGDAIDAHSGKLPETLSENLDDHVTMLQENGSLKYSDIRDEVDSAMGAERRFAAQTVFENTPDKFTQFFNAHDGRVGDAIDEAAESKTGLNADKIFREDDEGNYAISEKSADLVTKTITEKYRSAMMTAGIPPASSGQDLTDEQEIKAQKIANVAVREGANTLSGIQRNRVLQERESIVDMLTIGGNDSIDAGIFDNHESLRGKRFRKRTRNIKYSDDEARDEHGEWTSGGGSLSGSTTSDEPKSSAKVPQQSPSPKTKSEIAKQSATRTGSVVQKYADVQEQQFAKQIGGVSFKDSEPVDVVSGKGGVVEHGTEIKTMAGGNKVGKITMDKYAQVRKVNWEKDNKATFHTVVIDDRGVKDAGGEGEHDQSQRVYYYRRGIAGSARVTSMEKCDNIGQVKKLMAMDETKLPANAQRTDGEIRSAKWTAISDKHGKGFKNAKTGEIVRPKK